MNNFPLPENLPAPIDDGSANHLTGLFIPEIQLKATDGTSIKLQNLKGLTVIYIYPRTGKPGQALPEGWDLIPGARGCTPQSCGYKDLTGEFQKNNVRIYGLSSQDTEYQQEVWKRLQLPFLLLSDEKLQLKNLLNFPTFVTSGMQLYRRMTLVLEDDKIVKVFYPVFPPDKNAEQVLKWIGNH